MASRAQTPFVHVKLTPVKEMIAGNGDLLGIVVLSQTRTRTCLESGPLSRGPGEQRTVAGLQRLKVRV